MNILDFQKDNTQCYEAPKKPCRTRVDNLLETKNAY